MTCDSSNLHILLIAKRLPQTFSIQNCTNCLLFVYIGLQLTHLHKHAIQSLGAVAAGNKAELI